MLDRICGEILANLPVPRSRLALPSAPAVTNHHDQFIFSLFFCFISFLSFFFISAASNFLGYQPRVDDDNNSSYNERIFALDFERRSLHFYEFLCPFSFRSTANTGLLSTCTKRGRVLFGASSWNSCATIYTKSIFRLDVALAAGCRSLDIRVSVKGVREENTSLIHREIRIPSGCSLTRTIFFFVSKSKVTSPRNYKGGRFNGTQDLRSVNIS